VLTTAGCFSKQHGFHCKPELQPPEYASSPWANSFDVILLNLRLYQGDNDGKRGLYWLEQILQLDATCHCDLISIRRVELAVQAGYPRSY